MFCKSCKEDVPPKFTHAFAVNICPLCGQEIMDIKLKNILGELKVALGDAQDYMAEVEDWLFSNFGLKKIGANDTVIDKAKLQVLEQKSAALTSSIIKHPGTGPGVTVNRREDGDDVEVDEKATTVFAKRAGVMHAKTAVDFIKGKTTLGAADPSEFQGVDDEYGDTDLMETAGNETPLSTVEKNQMASMFKENDLANASPALELQKLKRVQAQNAVAGGGGGFFRRS